MKLVYLDFEFNHSKDEAMNVVCVSLLVVSGKNRDTADVWLENDEAAKQEFITTIEEYIIQDYTFVAFSVVAEGRSLHSLGIDPRRIRWVDLALEWRMLLNHNHRHGCGKHLVDGKVKTIYPPIPKYDRTENDPKSGVAGFHLSCAIFKMLNINIDTDRKDAMRDLIIAGGKFSDEQKKEILDYCASDVIYLPELHQKIYQATFKMLTPTDRRKLNSEIYVRGDYAARSAVMETVGHPIDFEATKNFSASTGSILFELQEEINALFPEVEAFEVNRAGNKYRQKQKPAREWIAAQGHEDWMLTEKGALSLSLDAFQKYYNFTHSYPKNNFGAQMVRYLKTKQSLNGFMPSGKKKTFWDYVGSDNRVRPYMGIYRAQSGRSQPASTGFIPLKAAWMRSLIVPDRGRCIISIDYSQQEFLLAALLSQDPRMISAYESGDVYVYTGKLAGAIPQHGTKATHPELRDLFKSTTLGIQYMMGAKGLAKKLTTDTGIFHTQEQAQDLIDKFEEAYPQYQEWTSEIWAQYKGEGYLKLPCGWTMWGDNANRRSACNFPIQGLGSSIMRKAVELCQDEGIDVIYTLHDALYIEVSVKDAVHGINELATAMSEAVAYYFKDTNMERHAHCRLDPAIWGPGLGGTEFKTDLGPVKATNKYIDPRAIVEYRQFKKYLAPRDEIDLLKNI